MWRISETEISDRNILIVQGKNSANCNENSQKIFSADDEAYSIISISLLQSLIDENAVCKGCNNQLIITEDKVN